MLKEKHFVSHTGQVLTKHISEHSKGMAFVFRQPKAQSHCRHIHTYQMAVEVEVEHCRSLNAMQEDYLLQFQNRTTLVVTQDDPNIEEMFALAGGHNILLVPQGGCERLAEYFFNSLNSFNSGHNKVLKVTVAERPSNYASYDGEYFYSGKRYSSEAGLTTTIMEDGKLSGGCLQIDLCFKAKELDHTNFVVDFGALKNFKATLEESFDHKTWVREKELEQNKSLATLKDSDGVSLVTVDDTYGSIKEHIENTVKEWSETWLQYNGYAPRCSVESVKLSGLW